MKDSINLCLKRLRNLFKYCMMRIALAERIIQDIKSFRNLFRIILLAAYLAVVFFAFWLLPIFCGNLCMFIMPFLAIEVQKRLDDYISDDGPNHTRGFVSVGVKNHTLDEGGPDHTLVKGGDVKVEKSLFERAKDEDLEDFALKTMFPELDKIERLGNMGGMRVAAYVRVSTKRQAKHGMSLKAQEEELRKLAESMGASVIFWFIDAKSGKTFSGRKLGCIHSLAEHKMIDRLLVCEVDRIGRETCTLLGFILALRGLGVITVTPHEKIDVKSYEGILMASIKAIRAEEENEKRTHAALRSRIFNFKNGKWNLPVPIGYRKAGDWIEKIPEFEPLIKEVFSYFVSVKEYGRVTGYINRKYGMLLQKKLRPETIANMLQNPAYIGKPACGGEKTRRFFEDIQVEDKNLAFIDEDTFMKVQKIIREKKGRYERKENPAEYFIKNLGDDILKVFDEKVAFLCPHCEQPMRDNGKTYQCRKCGYQRRKIKKSEAVKIAEWILKREKSLKTFRKMLMMIENPGEIIDIFAKNNLPLKWFTQHNEQLLESST